MKPKQPLPPTSPLTTELDAPFDTRPTPARTLADELREKVRGLAPAADTYRDDRDIGYFSGFDRGLELVDDLLAAHPALRQPAPVAADGAGRKPANAAEFAESLAFLWDAQSVRSDNNLRWVAARVAEPLFVRLAAAEAARAAAEGDRDEWMRKAGEIGSAYGNLLMVNPGLLDWAARSSKQRALPIAKRIMRDFDGRLGPRVPRQDIEALFERIDRELEAVMVPQQVADAAARHISDHARAALAAPAGAKEGPA